MLKRLWKWFFPKVTYQVFKFDYGDYRFVEEFNSYSKVTSLFREFGVMQIKRVRRGSKWMSEEGTKYIVQRNVDGECV